MLLRVRVRSRSSSGSVSKKSPHPEGPSETYDGKQYGPLLHVEKAIVVYTRGSRFVEGTPIPPSRFDHQATYLDCWLKLAGVRDLRSVIVDNAWNRDRQESEVSLEKGKATLEQWLSYPLKCL